VHLYETRSPADAEIARGVDRGGGLKPAPPFPPPEAP